MKRCWACENPFPCAEHGRSAPGYLEYPEPRTDTKATPRPWRVVGDRCPIQSPSGVRVPMYVIAVDHPNGPWESIYCMTEKQAALIVQAVNAYRGLIEALHEIDSVSWVGDGRAIARAALAAAEGKAQ